MEVFLVECIDEFYDHKESCICSSLESVQKFTREVFAHWDMDCNFDSAELLEKLNTQFTKIILGENYIDGGSRATTLKILVSKKELDQWHFK